MTTSIEHLRNGALAAGLLTVSLYIPALAADKADDSSMPATPAQAEQMREVPDSAPGAKTEAKGMQEGDMPATKAQTRQLKESENLSQTRPVTQTQNGGKGMSQDKTQSSGQADLPGTPAQAEQLRKVPDAAAGTQPPKQGMEEDDMPATKAQKQQLEDSSKMSHDKGMSQDESSGGTTVPASPAQTEQLREVPDSAAGANAGSMGSQADDMPATKAQKEQLKNSDSMSQDDN